MCPCNFSFDHGATSTTIAARPSVFEYWQRRDRGDRCRRPPMRQVIIDTPKVMTEGKLARRHVRGREARPMSRSQSSRRYSAANWVGRWKSRSPGRRNARCRTCRDRSSARRPEGIAFGLGMGSTSRSRTSFRLAWRRAAPVRLVGLHPVASEFPRGGGDEVANQRVWDRVRRQDGHFDGRVPRGPLEGRTTWLTRRRTTGSVTADRGIARGLHRDQRNRAEHHGTRLAVLKTVDGAIVRGFESHLRRSNSAEAPR